MTKYYKDFTGVTARITEHRDGSATLKISTEKKARKYKNVNSAQAPEVYIIGSGKVARVITENNNIYIVGEEAANDIYLRGYSDGVKAGVDAYNRFTENDFIKQIEDKIINGDPEPVWIFKRDYHGEFKKKGEGNGENNN